MLFSLSFYRVGEQIDDFRVSDATLLGIKNSSIECEDVACDVEPMSLKDYKDLTMKLKVKYPFPNSSSGANFYIQQLPKGLGMRKILAHGIRMQKNPQTRENIFWVFMDFHEVYGSKVQLAPPHGNFINSVANPETVNSVQVLNFQKLLANKAQYALSGILRVFTEVC